MNRFVVTVDFTLKPGEMAASRRLIDENAQMSCEREPGCRRFAVLVPKGRTTASFFMKSVIAARLRYSLAVAALRHIQHDQRRPVMNENVAKLHLIFEGSNNRR